MLCACLLNFAETFVGERKAIVFSTLQPWDKAQRFKVVMNKAIENLF